MVTLFVALFRDRAPETPPQKGTRKEKRPNLVEDGGRGTRGEQSIYLLDGNSNTVSTTFCDGSCQLRTASCEVSAGPSFPAPASIWAASPSPLFLSPTLVLPLPLSLYLFLLLIPISFFSGLCQRRIFSNTNILVSAYLERTPMRPFTASNVIY